VKKYVSLWAAAARLLDMREVLSTVDEATDGYHIDVMDGLFVKEIAFGVDMIREVRSVTTKAIEAHLMVCDAPYWAGRVAAAGASAITVHSRPQRDLVAALAEIAAGGVSPNLAIELNETVPHPDDPVWAVIDRLLIMATAVGVRGAVADPAVYAKIMRARDIGREHKVAVFVDGGVTWGSIQAIAAAGADGVIAGSIALGAPDPGLALRRIGKIRSVRRTT
jgi:ribulose-phosphate 3-epimerase